MAGVGEEGERQRVLLAEARVRGLVVGADPENDGASFPETEYWSRSSQA
jgi:hypothetical protein